MKKIYYLLVLLVIVGTSCSEKRTKNEVKSISHRESGDLRVEMEAFFLDNLRYPRGTRDYCRRIYLQDSLNNFWFARGWSNKPNVRFNSYEEYNEFMDSVFSVVIKCCQGAGVPYFSWPRFYRNQRDNDIYCKDGKVFADIEDTDSIYYSYDIRNAMHDYYFRKKTEDDFHAGTFSTIMKLTCVRAYSKDSLFVDLPKSVFNDGKAYHDMRLIVDSVILQINKRNPDAKTFHYAIRYHKNGKFESADKEWDPLPAEITSNKNLIHYMDSCVRIDKRVDFIQFYRCVYLE